ncbi:valine--tRNA ligase [Candidatus Kaiserbacteria bacterium]|nr:valine--tRNA ligase [Candidatus Kaiserbacteria bacterium]
MSDQIPDIFLSPYDSEANEKDVYALWEKSGYFNPDTCVEKGVTDADAETFSVVLPPPNVTGVLHIGHAYEDSLQDAFVRYHRMNGKKTLWVPGTDSAAIATQARVEKNIRKEENKTRHDLGREELVRRVSEFAKNSEDTILSQVRRVGASLDWSRYAYTLDEKRTLAVSTAFKRMYDAGLIYRGNRIVNWDPKGQTTISDDEVVHEERKGVLYTFKYSSDFPIAISTTRPETKVGDVAVAVHPDDTRYQEFIGKEYDLTFCDVPLHITVVADDGVDMEFGTGALGVTPAHSHIDWEIAEKNDLPRPQVINEYAKMMVSGRLENLKVDAAREAVVTWLKEENLLEKEEEVDQNISTSERTGAVIEPLPKLQWWVAVNKPFTIEHSEIPGIASGSEATLVEVMRASVESESVSMPQERFRKTYFHWIDNLRDWCISRQIWFGHRIPVWYKGDEIHCGVTTPEGEGWTQEEDVLDTWFSSALWTFSTLGWPEETADLKTFHPTAFMSPAYEILPLWVSRMILMSAFHLGQVPFKTVMIHGLVRDKSGRKFSKSLNNGIDPIEMIEKYGADALRMGLLVGTAIGNDLRFDESKVKGYKHFANKLWNITRFILTNIEEVPQKPDTLGAEDQEILDNLQTMVREVSGDIDKFQLYLAAEKAYHYVWHELADKILEESKPILNGEDTDAKNARQYVLYECLTTSLKILHPFMPFVTETIWQHLPEKDSEMLMVAKWPG